MAYASNQIDAKIHLIYKPDAQVNMT